MPKMSLAAQKWNMATYIEIGLKKRGTREVRYDFINERGACSVTGFALLGKFGSLKEAMRSCRVGVPRDTMPKALGIDVRLFTRIEKLHSSYHYSASEIAKMLRDEAKKAKVKVS